MSRIKRSLPIERASFRDEHTIHAWGLVWQRDFEDDGVWYSFHEGEHEFSVAAQAIRIGFGWRVSVYPDPDRFIVIKHDVCGDLDDAMCEVADELYIQRGRIGAAA